MLHCYLLQVFSCVEINLECQLYYRDDARISKLYDGLQCNEISMETGDFCNANRRCVMPSTPGDPESTCPPQAVRTIRRRKVEKRKKAKAKDRRKKGNRLVGASAQHTEVNLQLRYPWICSLKTRGFRWLSKVKNRLTFILRGRHLCSLTLLSAPPRKTILVGPAHCNFLCKDDSLNVVEVCCCRSPELANSCKEVE